MKWYYEWRLRRVRAKIAALQEATQPRLKENYTDHSRLRVLSRVESGLLQRLAGDGAQPARAAESPLPVPSAPEKTPESTPAAAAAPSADPTPAG